MAAIIIEQGTTVVMVGPYVTTDGYTLDSDATLSTARVKLSKNGAKFVAKASTKASSHSTVVGTTGMYRIFLTTVDSGTVGHLKLVANTTHNLPVWVDYQVVPANPYDTIFVGTTVANSVKNMTSQIDFNSVKKGTAFEFDIVMVKSTDHRAPSSGSTLTGFVSLDGTTWSTMEGTITEVGDGVYHAALSTDDTAGNYNGTYRFTATGADARVVTIKISK